MDRGSHSEADRLLHAALTALGLHVNPPPLPARCWPCQPQPGADSSRGWVPAQPGTGLTAGAINMISLRRSC
jgi:hypothetical protein